MIENRLRELRILLPIPPKSAGSYIPVVVSGNLVFVSGQIPIEHGQLKYQGKVKNNQYIQNAQNAAKLCIINALSQLNTYFGTLEHIEKIVKVSQMRLKVAHNLYESLMKVKAPKEILLTESANPFHKIISKRKCKELKKIFLLYIYIIFSF